MSVNRAISNQLSAVSTQQSASKIKNKEARRRKARAVCSALVFPFIIGALLIAVTPSFSSAATADEEVARIQKAYEGIKDIQGAFVQRSFIKDLKRTDTYNGQFFIKPPKVKWEFKGDRPQVVYITGDDIIIYQKKEKQAFRSQFDRATYGQAPIALLSGFGDIRKEFDISMRSGRLHLKPKRPMGNIAAVELETAPSGFPIAALFVTDTLGNRIEIQLKNVRTNTGVGDKVFEFSPPEGVNVIRQ